VLEHGPEFDSQIPAAEVSIRLNDGRVLSRRVEKSSMTGDPSARMADAALKSKFVECAGGLMPESQIERIIEMCLRLETLGDVSEPIKLTKVSERLQ
jgi:2-methylcitrate dehydratase PrpD